MILQLAFVLTAIIIGARLGGIGLGVMGGVGLGIPRSFWFTTHRTSYRRYVDDCRRHFAASCMQAAEDSTIW